MKKITSILAFLFCALTVTSQITFSEHDIHAIAKGESRAFRGNITRHITAVGQNYDVVHYRCFWEVNPAVKYISGYVTTRFKPQEANFDEIAFNLSDSLTVDSVVYHNLTRTFTHTADTLSIQLTAIIPQHTLDSVTIFYKGEPPKTGFGSFIQAQHNSTPVIWTLSEPYGASDWWPCKNDLLDKADSIDVFIKTPAPNIGVSNGLRISSVASGSDSIFHWKHRYPIATYLICMATSNYVRFTHEVPYTDQPMMVENFVYPEDSATLRVNSGNIVPMIQLYDSLFGIYPFKTEKYGHTQFSWGGGMEHQTNSFMYNFGFELMAHELAHQWFGDKVTCGSWEDIWLNEGFATYLSGLCYEHLQPSEWMNFKKARMNSVTSQPGGSVFCTDTTSVPRIFDGRLSYNKGAMVLHQLRWILGDDDFFQALQNYLTDSNVSHWFAFTSDLKSHFEATSGKNLTGYFNDWYTGEGYPSYQFTWSQNAGNQISMSISQTQSHASVPFFELPLPVQFKNATQDTTIVFNHTFSGQTFTADLSFQADTMIFDPEVWIISKDNLATNIPENQLLDKALIYPNPAKDVLHIQSKTPIHFVKIVDAKGQTYRNYPDVGISKKTIDISDLATGIYFVHVQDKESEWTEKLIVE